MKILVLNASPKGQNSTTVQTALYLQALHPEHTFTFLPVGQRIKAYEKDFAPVRAAGTIRLEGGRPVWGDHCYQCLRCLHACPRQAIQYGKDTGKKGRYHLAEYLPD